MENKKDAGKEQRVVLNLNMAQAEALNSVLKWAPLAGASEYHTDICRILQPRIEKTINKHEQPQALSCRDNFATTMQAIEEAAQEVIDSEAEMVDSKRSGR